MTLAQMHSGLTEHRIRCPFCGESLCILLDLSAGSQSYVEDCQVCCQPMLVSFEFDGSSLGEVRVDCA